jgi:hypothetical protein
MNGFCPFCPFCHLPSCLIGRAGLACGTWYSAFVTPTGACRAG